MSFNSAFSASDMLIINVGVSQCIFNFSCPGAPSFVCTAVGGVITGGRQGVVEGEGEVDIAILPKRRTPLPVSLFE